MAKTRTVKYTANACRWRDKINGNTYHSVRIVRHRDGAILYCPIQYGYGDQYRQTALKAMAIAKWLPKSFRATGRNDAHLPGLTCYDYERESNYPILWFVTDGLKRDCVENGHED